jgi:general stress protein YciG
LFGSQTHNLIIIPNAKEETHMSGTAKGGRLAAQKNKAKYGADFYAKIGSRGGKNGHKGGFAANKELARIAGARGGRLSRRGRAKPASEAARES